MIYVRQERGTDGEQWIRFGLTSTNQPQYVTSMRYAPAAELYAVLDAAWELCSRTSAIDFRTTVRSAKRRTVIELSKSNGLVFTVTDKEDGVFIGEVYWSYLKDWFDVFERAIS